MNKIYLFALLIAVASANLAIDLDNLYVPSDTFKCFSQKNVNKVVIQMSNEMGNTNIDFLTHFTNAKNAGIPSVDATVIVNDTFFGESISSKVANALPSGFNGIVWLRVYNSPQLWTKNKLLRIPYLVELVNSFRQHNLKVGISSEISAWTSVFGLKHAGIGNLNSAPVWYVHQDAIQSFDDFNIYGYGTWTQPTMKTFQFPVTICDTRVPSFNYYEGDAVFKMNK